MRRREFLKAAKAAHWLFAHVGPLQSEVSLRKVRALVPAAFLLAEEQLAVEVDREKDWIRSEALAAILWSYRSPDVDTGCYATVDVGAGTTNVAFFRICREYREEHWAKGRVAFFEAGSHPTAMDAINKAVAEADHLDASHFVALRGYENKALQQAILRNAALVQVDAGPRETYRRCFGGVMKQIPNGCLAECDNWFTHRQFVIGGGGTVKVIHDRLRLHPRDDSKALTQKELILPPDLAFHTGGKVTKQEMAFLNVAYGLSYLGREVPESKNPTEIEPMPPVDEKSWIGNEEKYAS